MKFEITVLGSNSAIPAHGRNQTSQLVEIGMSSMLLDCGEGTQIQLRKFKLKYGRVDFIFISHLHGDHYFGIMGMISTFHLHKRTRLLTIFGPNGLDEIITVQLKHSNTRLNFPIRFVATNPNQKELILEEENFRVFSLPLKHRIPCTGFIVQEKKEFRKLIKEKLLHQKIEVEAIQSLLKGKDYMGPNGNLLYAVKDYTYPPEPPKTYAFCSDTIYDPDLVPHLKGVSLLYHESTFTEIESERAKETFHSTARQAGLIAKAAGVNKLLLGHYSTRYVDLTPMVEEARFVFAESFLSIEGERYTVE